LTTKKNLALCIVVLKTPYTHRGSAAGQLSRPDLPISRQVSALALFF
jgi:hypothetical protein